MHRNRRIRRVPTNYSMDVRELNYHFHKWYKVSEVEFEPGRHTQYHGYVKKVRLRCDCGTERLIESRTPDLLEGPYRVFSDEIILK